MKNFTLLITTCFLLAASIVYADGTTISYWNFTDINDQVGDIATVEVFGGPNMDIAPDLSIHPVYGESPGSGGNSLNSVDGPSGYLEGDVFDTGSSESLDFGPNDFSISYWSYYPEDADFRGPRIFDFLAGTDTGSQLGTTLDGIFNFRLDDDLDNTIISNVEGGLNSLLQIPDQWTHVSITVDRTNSEVTIYFNGSDVGSYDISALTGNIFPTIDLQIGVINGGTVPGQSQFSGLDDFAFYNGILSATQIADLANGTTTPDAYAPDDGILGDVNCDGDVNLLDVGPFVDLISTGVFSVKADINMDGAVNLLDVGPFVKLLSGG